MLTPGACARVSLQFPGVGVGVGVGVGLLVCPLMPELRVAGADTLIWAEPEAEWLCRWCSRLVRVSVRQVCWVGVGAGLVRGDCVVLVPHGMVLHHAAHSSISFGSLGAGEKTLGVDAALNQWVISPSS